MAYKLLGQCFMQIGGGLQVCAKKTWEHRLVRIILQTTGATGWPPPGSKVHCIGAGSEKQRRATGQSCQPAGGRVWRGGGRPSAPSRRDMEKGPPPGAATQCCQEVCGTAASTSEAGGCVQWHVAASEGLHGLQNGRRGADRCFCGGQVHHCSARRERGRDWREAKRPEEKEASWGLKGGGPHASGIQNRQNGQGTVEGHEASAEGCAVCD